jgi:hypothetical protein
MSGAAGQSHADDDVVIALLDCSGDLALDRTGRVR